LLIEVILGGIGGRIIFRHDKDKAKFVNFPAALQHFDNLF